jgi:hypothetical protein
MSTLLRHHVSNLKDQEMKKIGYKTLGGEF